MVLVCLLIVIGWLGYHQQKAVAETTKSKTDLSKAKSELFGVTQARDKLEEHLTQLTKERDELAGQIKVAQTTINNLKTQLNDQIARAGDLQTIIDQLENKLKEEADEAVNSKLLGIVFTTGWNEGEKVPKNDLKEISINEKCLYVFCKWRLSLKDHTYTIKIFDESKQIIYEKKDDLKPTEPTWNTWPGYYINKYIDKPGRWTVEVYLDGRKVEEKSINVLPEVKTISSNRDKVVLNSYFPASVR